MPSGWKAEDTENLPGVGGWGGAGAGGDAAPQQVRTHGEVVGEPLQVDVLVLLQEHTDDQPVHLQQGLLSPGWRAALPLGLGLVTDSGPAGSPALPLGRPSALNLELLGHALPGRGSWCVQEQGPAREIEGVQEELASELQDQGLCTHILRRD